MLVEVKVQPLISASAAAVPAGFSSFLFSLGKAVRICMYTVPDESVGV